MLLSAILHAKCVFLETVYIPWADITVLYELLHICLGYTVHQMLHLMTHLTSYHEMAHYNPCEIFHCQSALLPPPSPPSHCCPVL